MQETNFIDRIKERYTQYNLSRVESLDMLRASDLRRLCFDVGVSLIILVFLEILLKNAVLYFMAYIVNAFFGESAPAVATAINYLYASIVSYAPKFIVFYVLYQKYKKLGHLLPTYSNLPAFPAIMLLATFSFGMCGSQITELISSIFQLVFGTGEIPDVMQQTAPADSSSGLVMLFFSAIVAPICEELIYRKLLLGSMRPMGDTPAILVSSLIFGLAHGNFDQFAYAALSGMVFGIIAVRYKSIVPTILLHVANNLLVSVSVYEQILLTGNKIADGAIIVVSTIGNIITFISYFAMPLIIVGFGLCGIAKLKPVTGEDKKEKLMTVFCPVLIFGLFVMLMKFI